MEKMLRCACCMNYTIPADDADFSVCPVCFWEKDKVQERDPEFSGGANEPNLTEARANYADFGASDRKFADKVRKPTTEELP